MSAAPRRRASGHPFAADRVYAELRAQLLGGEIPAAERLTEHALAARFATSRTPVREALRRLEGDGHLERDSAGSLRASVPSVRSMRELYDVRMALEDLTAQRAASAGDRGVLEDLENRWTTLAATDPAGLLVEFVHEDEAFHDRVALASGNEFARRVLSEINDRIRPLRVHEFIVADRVSETITEHREILRAILAGEDLAAGAFMRAHISRSALVVRTRMADALARMSR
ncbi:MAG: hypothetical protein QOF76_5168 [Solirubrobacteraceae bacterium]|nr:hypothetical protein [Solirubrobacteraceae bacterium]